MTGPILHYIHDPLCGWCYAAEPLVQNAATTGIPVAFHSGGLWGEPIHASAAKRRMIWSTDDRIGQITGQPFGEPYLDGLLVDPDTIWHSRPTIAAIFAAQRLAPGAGLAMMAATQRAHYVEGSRVVERTVLVELARRVGLDHAAFSSALDDVPVDRHIHATSALMREHDIHGFPTFLVERDGTLSRLHHEGLYGRREAFVAALAELMGPAMIRGLTAPLPSSARRRSPARVGQRRHRACQSPRSRKNALAVVWREPATSANAMGGMPTTCQRQSRRRRAPVQPLPHRCELVDLSTSEIRGEKPAWRRARPKAARAIHRPRSDGCGTTGASTDQARVIASQKVTTDRKPRTKALVIR